MKLIVDDIECSVIRSRRKTADIVVERDGAVVMRAPEDVSEEDLREVISRKARWIHTARAEWEALNSARTDRPFLAGSGFLYLGKTYRLKIIKSYDPQVRLTQGQFVLSEWVLNRGEAAARKAFRDFYSRRGEAVIPDRMENLAFRIGVEPGPVTVKELGYHWASCGAGGSLNFHWKLLMAPVRVLDYVIAHELCHLRHRDHTSAFWNEVDKAMPDYRERKDWLREFGARMDF